MTDKTPYLLAVIAHGKPVFEIAYQMECPMCVGSAPNATFHCNECDNEGFWWITNTGWRARPYSYTNLYSINLDQWLSINKDIPEDWPDLFQSYIDRQPRSAEPSSLLASLGLSKPKAPITRRVLK